MLLKNHKIRLLVVPVLILFFLFRVTIWSPAQGLSTDLFENPVTREICFRTVKSNSDEEIGYKVLGFTMHRADTFGDEEKDTYITLTLNDTEDAVTEGGNTVIIRKLNTEGINDKLLKADPTGTWLNDWNSAKPGSVWFNAILTTYTRKKDASGHWVEEDEGSLNEDGSYTGKVYDFGTGKESTDHETAGTLKDILQKYSWTGIESGTIPGLFHILYSYNVKLPDGDSEEEGDVVKDLTESGIDQPELYTWHTSDEYDIGEGIPSGSTMTNGFLASRWYGTYAYEKTRTRTRNYYLTYIVKGQQYITEKVQGKDGGYEDRSYWRPWTTYVPVTVTRSASYYAIRKIGLYKLSNVSVYNGAYDVIQYPVEDDGSTLDTGTDVKINGETPSAYKEIYSSDPDKHITWPTDVMGDTITVSGDHAPMTVEEAEQSYQIQNRAEDKVGNVISRNDSFILNGTVYMDGREVSGQHTEDMMPAPAELSSDVNSISFVYDTKEVGIPVSRANGKYTTTIDAQYRRVFPEDNILTTAEKKGTSAIIKNSRLSLIDSSKRPTEDMDLNEPVVVHTPVVSPVTFHDSKTTVTLNSDNTKTQTAVPAKDAWNRKLYDAGITGYDLLLDNTYELQFDPYQWISTDTRAPESMKEESVTQDGKTGYDISHDQSNGYRKSTYDKYIAKREARFPFDVAILDEGTGEKIYYAADKKDDATGQNYTDWIETSSDRMKFYIPVWAKESSSVFGKGNQDHYYEAEFRVYARNSGGHENEEEELSNSELDTYVATFQVPVNISGSVYDFRILGINDRDMYYGYDKSNKNTVAALFRDKNEKAAGSKDRFGTASFRNILDGTIRKNIGNKDILPLHNGSSEKYSEMGALWRGTTFSFSLKTMGGYTDDSSEIRITPSFRYYDKNGTEQDVEIFYTGKNGTEKNKFIPYGSAWDTYYGKVSLSDPLLKGSLDKDALIFTEKQNGVTENAFLNRKNDCYSLSDIRLTGSERLFTGSLYDLSVNSGKDFSNPDFFGHPGTTSENGTIKFFNGYQEESDSDDGQRNTLYVSTELLNENTSYGKAFRKSVQTWYGTYTIPEDLYVTTKDRLRNEGYNSVQDYAKSGKLSRNSDIWIHDGYLMLNFHITVYKNGIKQLEYDNSENSGLDMWKQQGMLEKVNLLDQVRTDTGSGLEKGLYKNHEISVKSGDIALIDLRYGQRDKNESGLYLTNR